MKTTSTTATVTSAEGATVRTYENASAVAINDDHGALVVLDETDNVIALWAPGSWQRVETGASEVTA